MFSCFKKIDKSKYNKDIDDMLAEAIYKCEKANIKLSELMPIKK